MTINGAPQIAEIERSVPPNRDQQQPPVLAEAKRPKAAEPEIEKPDPEKLKTVLAESNISLKFRRDEESGRLVVEMIDDKTGDAVRQIPSEVSLRLGELFSKVQGQLFEARV